MPQLVKLYRILVSSPGDCIAEREIVPRVITSWNAAMSLSTAAVIESVLWESHAVPELGDRPQAIINKQLVAICDLLVGVFWTRLGTDTGVAASGTVEEIQEFRRAGKPVLLYFSGAPVRLSDVDQRQYQALLDYKQSVRPEGITFEYSNSLEFERLLRGHLDATMAKLHNRESVAGPEEPYAALVPKLYALVDTFLKHSERPPRRTLDDYIAIEDEVKTWAYEHQLGSDRAIADGVIDVGAAIRTYFDNGNFIATVVGGSGRPDAKLLATWKLALAEKVNALVDRIQTLHPPPSGPN